MTGEPSLETAVAGLKSGVCEYIIKPFSVEYLQSVIRNCLEKASLSTELAREREIKGELEAAYTQLKDSEKAKDAFLARVNHELRTPLSVAITSSEVVCAELKKTGNLEIWKKLDGALRSLHAVIEELLLYSNLSEERLKLKTGETDLWELLSGTLEGLKDLCAETGVKVELAKEGVAVNLFVEGELIGSAFRQLMLNAIKFNKKGGKIFVLARYSSYSVSFVFSDTGIGMSPSDMAGLFTPFYQAAFYLTREVGGMGLGLATVKKIALLHDGDIFAQIKPEGGMTFTLTLPVKR
jgi:signal transduction histidine kinase